MKARRWAYARQSTKPWSWSLEILSAALTMPWRSKMWSAVMFSREAQTDGGAGPDWPACPPARERGRVRIAEEDLRLHGRRRAFGHAAKRPARHAAGRPPRQFRTAASRLRRRPSDDRARSRPAVRALRGAPRPALPLPARRCGEDVAGGMRFSSPRFAWGGGPKGRRGHALHHGRRHLPSFAGA